MDAKKRCNEADLADLRRSSRPNKGYNPKFADGEEKRKSHSKEKTAKGTTQRHGKIQEDESGSGSIISELFLFGSENLRMGRKNSSKASSMRSKKTTSSVRKERLRLIAEMEIAEAKKILAEKRLQFQMLGETDEEDDISEEEHVENLENPEKSKNYVESWLEKLPQDKEKDVEEKSCKNDEISDVGKAASHVSEENVKRSKAPSCKSCCGSKEENSQIKAIESLVSGFTEAIKMLSAKPAEDSSNKIIARQAMGRELPSFTGNPEEWPNFISEYKRTTKDCSYSNIENMLRLRKCLHGEAKQIVSSMLMIPENVDLVIDALESHFGKPEYIIRVLIDKVHKTPSPRKDKLSTFIQYATVVRNLVTTMNVLGENGHMSNPQLMSDMIEKLPNQQKLEWGRYVIEKGNKNVTVLDFSNWLNDLSEVVRTVSKFNMPSENQSMKNIKQENKHDFKKEKFHKNVFAVNETSEKKVKCDGCEYCLMKNHTLEKCWKFLKLTVEERKQFLIEKRLCFSCLHRNCHISICDDKKTCGVDKCKSIHHVIIHEKRDDRIEKVGAIQTEDLSSHVLLKILPVTLIGPSGEISTYAFLDGGSTITTMHESLAQQLGLKGKVDPLRTRWTNGVKHVNNESRRVSLKIKGENGNVFDLSNVRTDKDLDLCMQSINVKKLSKYWNHLKDVSVSSLKNAKPLILIGQDNNELLRPRSCISGGKNVPDLTLTSLGWVIHGCASSLLKSIVDKDFTYTVSHQNEDWQELNDLVKESFSTDAFGVKANVKSLRSKEDERAICIMENTTKRIEDRWETGLLWRSDEINMPKSKSNAFHRLKIMERKMDKDPNFAKQYCEKIDDYVKKNYARKLSREESAMEDNRTFYLPHFGVFHPKKPGKLRFVFDAAAKCNGESLNDKLIKGPDLLNSLTAVLLKFRQRKVAFTADIKEMYHQVRIREEDQNSQRFLWRGMDRKREPDTYVMKAMTFGATSSPCSAQFVKNKNAMEFIDKYPRATNAIVEKHYVDDYLDSCDNENEAIQLVKDVIKVHEKGGFLICNWISNSKNVLNEIPTELRADGGKEITESSLERVLGLYWNPTQDIFTFSTKFTKIDAELRENKRRPTKREILKTVMSVYDPLGFLAHFMIKAKILLQDIWRAEIGWDQEIPESLHSKWTAWLEKLKEIPNVSIPRCYNFKMAETTKIELHTFCDASERAFAAVSYFRMKMGENYGTAFVAAKTRVAPLRQMSIPRLELQAAVMASRLAKTITENHEIKIDEHHFWSDSSTVLCWIRSESRRFKPFVAHRVSEILELTQVKDWHWIPTKENVSDDATRDSNENYFHKENRWFSGPDFLSRDKCNWPTEVNMENEVDESILELKSEILATVVEQSKNNLSLPDIMKFSSFSKLTRITAWMLRFVNNCKLRNKNERKMTELSPLEIRNAENRVQF